MATNHIKLGINYRKNKNTKSPSYGKYYAEVDRQKTLTARGLSEHIASHNFGMGRDAIEAVLVKLSECIPELLSQGIPVKLDGLGIFSVTVANDGKKALTEAQLKASSTPSEMVQGIRIRFKPDGEEMNNLTSKRFLQDNVSLESRYIVESKTATVDGEEKTYQSKMTLEEFRMPAQNNGD